MRVLSGAGAVAETRLSYVGLTDLLDDVDPAYVAALPAPQREALDAALLRAHTPARSSSWEAVASGVRSLLETLSAEQPVVIAIDDLQWLDRSSARVLDFCIGRLNGRVGLIVTQRPGSEGVRIAQLSDRRDAVVRRLAPLDSAAIAALLREQARSAPSRRVLTRIAETAGGNPLYALELLRALPEGELTTGPLALPPTLREMVATRLAALGEELEELLLAVAALSNPTVQLLTRALGPGVPTLLDQAEEQGVLEQRGVRVRFTHPLLAEGALAHASAARRRAMHRRLSEVVDDVEDRARHLALRRRAARGAAGAGPGGALHPRPRGTRRGRRAAGARSGAGRRSRAEGPRRRASPGRGRRVSRARSCSRPPSPSSSRASSGPRRSCCWPSCACATTAWWRLARCSSRRAPRPWPTRRCRW